MATFGKTTVGGTATALAADTKHACKFTAPADINEVDSLTAYLNRSDTGGGYAIRGGIYTDNVGAPDTLVANSPMELSTNIARNSAQWYTATYVTKPTLTPGAVYWLCVQAAKNSVTSYDAGASNQWATLYPDAYSDGLSDPFGVPGAYQAREMSIYVSYTPSATYELLAGVIAGVSSAVGTVARLRGLSGAAASASSSTGKLNATLSLSGTTVASSTLTATLGRLRPLTGTIAGISAAVGSLTLAAAGVALAGVVAGVSSVTGAVARLRGLTGVAAGAANIVGAVVRLRGLTGAGAGVSSVTGTVVRLRGLAAVVSGASIITAALGRTRPLAALVSGLSTVTSTLSRVRRLSGTVAAASVLSGTIINQTYELLAGVVAGVSSMVGNLNVLLGYHLYGIEDITSQGITCDDTTPQRTAEWLG